MKITLTKEEVEQACVNFANSKLDYPLVGAKFDHWDDFAPSRKAVIDIPTEETRQKEEE